jgi:uncharacterized membrane protein YczE
MLTLCVGLTIAHLGVTLFMLTNLGSDPFNVFVQGLNRLTPFSHGITHMCMCFLIILILLFVDRRYIKAGTLVCMLLGGPIIDGFTYLLGDLINESMYLPVRLLIVTAACLILAFGMTIVIQSDAGTGPNDLVAVAVSEKLYKPFGMVRVIVDFSFVLIGVLLGGVFGVGTLFCAFLVGTAAGFFMPVSRQIVEWILEKTM